MTTKPQKRWRCPVGCGDWTENEVADENGFVSGCKECGYALETWPVFTGSPGVELIAAERQRQVEEEGWSIQHDDEHQEGEMALAAACYAAPLAISKEQRSAYGVAFVDPWPWDKKWDGRTERPINPNIVGLRLENRIRELVKAGALIAAEIDRLKREEAVEEAAMRRDGQ